MNDGSCFMQHSWNVVCKRALVVPADEMLWMTRWLEHSYEFRQLKNLTVSWWWLAWLFKAHPLEDRQTIDLGCHSREHAGCFLRRRQNSRSAVAAAECMHGQLPGYLLNMIIWCNHAFLPSDFRKCVLHERVLIATFLSAILARKCFRSPVTTLRAGFFSGGFHSQSALQCHFIEWYLFLRRTKLTAIPTFLEHVFGRRDLYYRGQYKNRILTIIMIIIQCL